MKSSYEKNLALPLQFQSQIAKARHKANKVSHQSGIDEHLTINAMLFSHLDKQRKESLSLDDISKGIKGVDKDKLQLSKADWTELAQKFKMLDKKDGPFVDFQIFLKLMESSETMKKVRVWYLRHLNSIFQKSRENELSNKNKRDTKAKNVSMPAPLESERRYASDGAEIIGSRNAQDDWHVLTQQDVIPTDDNRSQETYQRSSSTLNLESRIPSTSLIKTNPYVPETTAFNSALSVTKPVIQRRLNQDKQQQVHNVYSSIKHSRSEAVLKLEHLSFNPKKPRQVIDQMILQEVKSIPQDSEEKKSEELGTKLQSNTNSDINKGSQITFKPDCIDGVSINSDLITTSLANELTQNQSTTRNYQTGQIEPSDRLKLQMLNRKFRENKKKVEMRWNIDMTAESLNKESLKAKIERQQDEKMQKMYQDHADREMTVQIDKEKKQKKRQDQIARTERQHAKMKQVYEKQTELIHQKITQNKALYDRWKISKAQQTNRQSQFEERRQELQVEENQRVADLKRRSLLKQSSAEQLKETQKLGSRTQRQSSNEKLTQASDRRRIHQLAKKVQVLARIACKEESNAKRRKAQDLQALKFEKNQQEFNLTTEKLEEQQLIPLLQGTDSGRTAQDGPINQVSSSGYGAFVSDSESRQQFKEIKADSNYPNYQRKQESKGYSIKQTLKRLETSQRKRPIGAVDGQSQTNAPSSDYNDSWYPKNDTSRKLFKRTLHNRQKSQASVDRAIKSPLLQDLTTYTSNLERKSEHFDKAVSKSSRASQMRQRPPQKVSNISQGTERHHKTHRPSASQSTYLRSSQSKREFPQPKDFGPYQRQQTAGRSGQLGTFYQRQQNNQPYYIEENNYPSNTVMFPTIAQGSITSRVQTKPGSQSTIKVVNRSRREDFLVVTVLDSLSNATGKLN